MTYSTFHRLTVQHLSSLEHALLSGRLSPPYSLESIRDLVPFQYKEALLEELLALDRRDFSAQQIAFSLSLLREEKSEQQQRQTSLEWVWTGPELVGSTARDTAVVVRELFKKATSSVLISTYSLDQPKNTHVLFGELAKKMDLDPDLTVDFFLNIKREYRDTRPEALLLKDFARHFKEELWPGIRLPNVYYDPRALVVDSQYRASLHAKCIIVDKRYSLVTSANFSEAAHQRNIEAGLLLDDERRATSLQRQFHSLVEEEILLPLTIIEN